VFAVLKHVGRRSGRAYETPLGACSFGDGFILPLAYGTEVDWCRNVMAAGTCTLRWKGQEYVLERPEIITGPEAMSVWPFWQRFSLRAAV
jgi:deazaflavin-dependent oxidoreductase (nitroreductase family)